MVKIIKSIKRDILKEREDYASQMLCIESLAWENSFYQRRPKKITASNFVFGFWKMQNKGINSYRNWALQIGSEVNETVTKQGVDKRMNNNTVNFVKALLKKGLNESSTKHHKKVKKILKNKKQELKKILQHFNRVIIHDSTTQKLPQQLVEHFPGNRSHGEIKSVMRIQAAFDFTNEQWLNLTVGAYAENDQSNAKAILDKLNKSDLLIRDLGYFVLSAIEQIIDNQYLITKWDNKTSLFKTNGKPIELLSFLKKTKKNQQVDCPVLVGSENRIPMRMVARKLPQHKADQRIEQAKNDRHSKANHSDEYYELLKYEIYLTNIPSHILDTQQIAKMYGLRWYIEILFKSWKSYFNFKKIFKKDKMTYERTLITIYLVLIQFVYLTSEIYDYIKTKIEKIAEGRFISILKFMDIVNTFLDQILAIKKREDLDQLIPQFLLHALYEKRNDRKNMKEKFQYFNELTYC